MSQALRGAHAVTHESNGPDQVYYERGHKGNTVIDNMPRFLANTSQPMAAGTIQFCYVSAHVSMSVSRLRLRAGGTVSSLPTHTWLAIYSVAANGNMTLVFQSADIAALTDSTVAGSPVFFSQTNKIWSVPLTLDAGGAALASYTLQHNQRYAFAFLQVGGTAPSFAGFSSQAELLNDNLGPRITGVRLDTTLQSSYVPANISDTGLCPYIAAM